MVDMVLLVFQHFHVYRWGGWSQGCGLKIFFSYSLGGGGGGGGVRYSRGGLKTQGRGKHTIKPLPKTVLDPPTYDTFSPHLFTPCHCP